LVNLSAKAITEFELVFVKPDPSPRPLQGIGKRTNDVLVLASVTYEYVPHRLGSVGTPEPESADHRLGLPMLAGTDRLTALWRRLDRCPLWALRLISLAIE
jgi:hypothetical protein